MEGSGTSCFRETYLEGEDGTNSCEHAGRGDQASRRDQINHLEEAIFENNCISFKFSIDIRHRKFQQHRPEICFKKYSVPVRRL